MLKSIKGSETEKNLLKAFAGESQVNQKYTLFAEKAKEEGYDQISAIFLETALNEHHHARRFFSFLEGGEVEITEAFQAGVVGTTEENLTEAANGENEEWSHLYSHFGEVAKEEGYPQVSALFRVISEVEKFHESRYRKLLENIQNTKVFKKDEPVKWHCRACGYVHEGLEAPKVCPSCLLKQEKFEILSENY